MRAFLTGCNGYIGSHLSAALKGAGWKVVGLDRAGDPDPALDDYVHCDLLDTTSYADRLEGCSTVFHLAAAKGDWGISDQEYERDNVDATQCLIAACQSTKVTRWFHYSTVAVLGPSSTALDENSPRRPTGAYGVTKSKCEELLENWSEKDPDAEIVMIRPSAVFGPENPPSTNIYRLTEAIFKNRFVMIGDGHAIKTTSYIDNLIAATIFLIGKFQKGIQTFHYVDQPTYTTGDLVQEVYRSLNRRPSRLRVPLGPVAMLAGLSDFLGDHLGIDFPITRARIEKFCTETRYNADAIEALGFQAPVDLATALEATVTWHISQSRTSARLTEETQA